MAVGFGTDKFRDNFAMISTGIQPGIYATGNASGSPLAMGNFGKMVFELFTGSGAASSTFNLSIYASSASAGTYTAVTSLGTQISASTSNGSNNVAVIELRGEALTNLGSNYQWVKPVMSVGGASAYAALTAHGFVVDYGPASNFDAPAGFTTQEVDFF